MTRVGCAGDLAVTPDTRPGHGSHLLHVVEHERCYLELTGAVVYPEQFPGPLLRAELIISGMVPPGGFHNTTAVLPNL